MRLSRHLGRNEARQQGDVDLLTRITQGKESTESDPERVVGLLLFAVDGESQVE